MSDVAESISRLVEIARRLRAAADELGQVEIKSQIVDEISALQEIRDEVRETGSDGGHDSSGTDEAEVAEASSVNGLSDASMGIVEPTGNEETYSLTPEEEADPLEGVGSEAAEGGSESSVKEEADANLNERRAKIEMQIADLEQLEQVATKRMNDVLTVEQRQIKAKAQKAGREAGKAGKELQQYVYGAMKLSPEQKSEIQAARKDVLSLREAIDSARALLDGLNEGGS